jgi:hypothetical protein
MSKKDIERKKKVFCDICQKNILCNVSSHDTFALRSHEIHSNEHKRRCEDIGLLSTNSGSRKSHKKPTSSEGSDDLAVLEEKRKALRVAMNESEGSDDLAALEVKRKDLRYAMDDAENVSLTGWEVSNTETEEMENRGRPSVYTNVQSVASVDPNASSIVAALQTCGSLIESDDLEDSEIA